VATKATTLRLFLFLQGATVPPHRPQYLNHPHRFSAWGEATDSRH